MSQRVLLTGGSGFIGTNLIHALATRGVAIKNVDISPPKDKTQEQYWIKANILNVYDIQKVFESFTPQQVIHLAGETRIGGKDIEFYRSNFEGTANVLSVVKQAGCVDRVIVTSTQYVHQSDGVPKSDFDFKPLGKYGESKVLTEQVTRNANLDCVWTIVRPTNIWGPWNIVYVENLFKAIEKKRYLHPAGKAVMRSYGYVGNVVHQLLAILKAMPETVHQQVFYVGDPPMDLRIFVDAFSTAMTDRGVTVVPRWLLKGLAVTGDALGLLKIKCPLTSSRFKNMTVDNPAPMAKTLELLGETPYSLEAGVNETMSWYRSYGAKGKVLVLD